MPECMHSLCLEQEMFDWQVGRTVSTQHVACSETGRPYAQVGTRERS